MGRVAKALSRFVFGEERAPQPWGEPIPYSRYLGRNEPIVLGNVLALPIVRRCVGEVANLVASATPTIIRADGSRTTRMPSWLRNPSAIFNLRETIHQSAWSCVFNAEMFLVWDNTETLGGRVRPSNIWVPRPEDVSYYSDGKSITYYQWWNGGAEAQADMGTHRRTLSAPGVWRGVGTTRTGKVLTDSAQSTQKALDNHLLKDAILGVVFAFAGTLNKDQRTQFLQQLARNHIGPENAGAPLVTDGDLKVQRIPPSMEDAQLIDLMRELDVRIARNVFFLDLGEHGSGQRSLTYTNTAQLRARNWSTAAEPIARTIADAFSDLLGQQFVFDPAEPLRGSPADRSSLQAQMALTNERSIRSGLGPVYSIEEIREVTGLHGPGPVMPVSDSEIAELENALNMG